MAGAEAIAGGLAGILAVGLAFGACGTKEQESSAPALSASDPPVVIAHRGASAYAPEHTFAAWDLAVEMGADYLEQDLQMTADGELVVFHDEELDRTAEARDARCSGMLRNRTLADLAGCDVGSWFNRAHPDRARPEYVGLRIPTLAEVLDRYPDQRFYIETKSPETAPGMEATLVELLREHDLRTGHELPRVFLQSFSSDSLRRLAELAPEIPRVQLLPGRWSSRRIRGALREIASYAVAIGPRADRVDRALVDAAHRLGLLVHPYTVNDPAEMVRLMQIGADGWFTDRPDVARDAVDRTP